MMKSTAMAVAAGLLIGGLAAAPARGTSLSQAADERERVTLGRTNTIRGAKTRSMPVRIPRPALIGDPESGNTDLKIKGKGRFVGFALFSEQGSGLKRHGVFGGRPPKNSEIPALLLGYKVERSGDRFRIPAGNYTLYLLADGHDVSVTVVLRGLEGERRLRPNRPVEYAVATPKPHYTSSVAPGGPGNLYSAGADRRMSGAGFLFDTLWELHDAHADTEFNACLHDGKPEGPAPYAPGCPSSGPRDRYMHHSSITSIEAETGGWFFYRGGVISSGGHFGMGGSISSAAVIRDTGYIGVWLTLDD